MADGIGDLYGAVMRPLLLAALAVSLAAGPASGQFQGRIYPAPRAPLTLAEAPAGAAMIEVATADGLRLRGVEIAPKGDRPVLLVFHGNASSADGTAAWFAPLVAAGYGLIAAEYRGYSGNPGKADERGLAADADAFYARAKALAGKRRVIVVGHSLGGGVAFGLARRQRLDALVTIGTFTRLREMAPRIARAFISDRYDNAAAVPTLDEPYFLIHGTADETVPAAYGNALHMIAAKTHRAGGSYVLVGAGHHPDGALVAAVIEAIDARLRGRAGVALPDAVKVVPFGG